MSLIAKQSKRNTFLVTQAAKESLGTPLRSFLGCNNSANKINQPYGQLVKNKNMEYLYSGNTVYLKTKRGSTLTLDITNRAYGASLFTYNRANEFLVWVDGTDLQTVETDGTNKVTVTSTLTNNTQAYFVSYGQDTNAALFGVNGTVNGGSNTGIFKLTYDGATFTKANVANTPQSDHIAFSTMGGRLLTVYGHTIYWSKRQTGTGVLNLEDFDWTGSAFDQSNIVSPDAGTGFKFILDFGIDGIYFFKDTGIWALPNIDEPEARWRFPQCKADIGTISPKTVKRVNYGGQVGVIYLGTDKTLRFFAPSIQYNAGAIPSIVDSSSSVISDTFQTLLDSIPASLLDQCSASYFDRKYTLNYPEDVSNTQINKTIIVDTEKLLPAEGGKIPQPFWFESENMDYTDMVIKESDHTIHGFNINGYISELFVSDTFYEEMPTRIVPDQAYTMVDSGGAEVDDINDAANIRTAIEYSAYTAWYDFSQAISGGRELELIRGYINWEPTNSITMSVNATIRGGTMPDYDAGLTNSITHIDTSSAVFDVSLFDASYFYNTDQSISQNIRVANRGHYFNFGFYNNAVDEPASVYGIDPIFRVHRDDPVGYR